MAFEVPARLRPRFWRATIPLPLGGLRSGNLKDEVELARIKEDASNLNRQLDKERCARTVRRASHNMSSFLRRWEGTQEWKDNRPITNKGYLHTANIILRWAKTKGDPDAERITIQHVEEFLGQYDGRPTQKYQLRKTFRLMMKQAVRARWRPDNPVDDVRVRRPKTSVQIWTVEEVERYADVALEAGEPSLSAIILTLWEIGQRLTDVIRFEHDEDYFGQAGEFRFRQSKTNQPVAVPVSERLRAILKSTRRVGSPYLFHDAATGRPYADVDRLWHVFNQCRPKGCPLVLRALRHTCVVELARAGCEIPEIVAVTGHTLASAHEILQVYLPRDSRVATNAQRKRGLI